VLRAHLSGKVLLLSITLLPFPHRSASGQEKALGYSAQQLDCSRFLEIGESSILSQAGGRTRRQTSTRRGTWQFRATPSNQQVVLEGWLDSLAITRRSEEATISPDTDGLLGGRYRGTLSPTGAYTAQVHPFVPDEVAEVAGMHTALEDFFPLLARRALKAGESWTDSLGLTIRRLPDSALSGVPLYRFALERRTKSGAATTPGDTVPLKLRQTSDEHGQFVWHPLLGLLRRDRTIVVETTVPPGRSVHQAVRSKVEQRITLVRNLNPPGCQAPSAGGR
jgi:hypothetical protein